MNKQMITDFGYLLRRRGFTVGVGHFLRAEAILRRLGADADRETRKYLLCPVFAADARQQALFYRLYDEHFRQPPKDGENELPSQPDIQAGPVTQPVSQIRAHRYVPAGILWAVLIGLVWFWVAPPVEIREPGTVVVKSEIPHADRLPDETMTITLKPGPPPEPTFYQRYHAFVRAFAVAVLPLLAILRALYLAGRRKPALERAKGRPPKYYLPIHIRKRKPTFFGEGRFLETAKHLRTRVESGARAIDVPGTVRATISQSGFPDLRYRATTRPAEYLFLIDHPAGNDHYANYMRSAAEALADEGVFAEIYNFTEDPRICFREPGSRRVPISDLYARYPDHRLAIVGECGALADPVTGRLAEWTALFSKWPERAVLTPKRLGEWGMREVMLAGEFVVLPATLEGLKTMVGYFETEDVRDLKDIAKKDFRTPAKKNFRTPPAKKKFCAPEEDADALAEILDKHTFDWLCECAMYPEIHFNLTLYLGMRGAKNDFRTLKKAKNNFRTPGGEKEFSRSGGEKEFSRSGGEKEFSRSGGEKEFSRSGGEKEFLRSGGEKEFLRSGGEFSLSEEGLLRLLRLPWFRRGVIPERERKKLVARLSPERRQRVLEDIHTVLEENPPAEDAPEREMYELKLAIYKSVIKKDTRQYLRIIRDNEARIVTDHTLVTLIADNPPPTAVPVPEKLGRLFFRKGNRVFGWKSWVSVIPALAVALVAAFALPKPDAVIVPAETSAEFAFAHIPSGSFTMGSPEGEDGRDDDETQHRVTLTRDFYMQTTEVTQEQWKAVMGTKPWRFENCKPNCPVEQVSWEDADKFIQRLNQSEKSGMYRFRLPTEAEWEYACRAGSKTALYSGPMKILGDNNAPALDPIAWYGGNSCVGYEGGYKCADWPDRQIACDDCGPHPVGEKKPNAWGLYDMLGNVWEWCLDKCDWDDEKGVITETYKEGVVDPLNDVGSGRVVRGGSWDASARDCRSAYRDRLRPGVRNGVLGFRLVRLQFSGEEQ